MYIQFLHMVSHIQKVAGLAAATLAQVLSVGPALILERGRQNGVTALGTSEGNVISECVRAN